MKMKFSELVDQAIFVDGEKIGEVKDFYFDAQNWEVSHLEIQLTSEAAFEILGARNSIRNMLARSALKEGNACCTRRGIEIKISKAQMHIYLRPPE